MAQLEKETTIAPWGNSLGVRIPAEIARISNFADGSRVTIATTDHGILIKAVKPKRPKYSLKSLLDQITTDNLHPETDWGQPEGNEAL